MEREVTTEDVAVLVEALVKGDEAASVSVVRALLRRGVDGPAVYLSLFQPALREVGDRWHRGELAVGVEHRATALVRWLMDLLAEQFALPLGSSSLPVLTACVAGERHEIGLLMVSRFMRRAGFRVVELGGDTPEAELAAMAQLERPRVVLLSATDDRHVPAVRAAIGALRAASYGGPVIVGGGPFVRDPGLAAAVGADAGATDALSAVEAVRRFTGAA